MTYLRITLLLLALVPTWAQAASTVNPAIPVAGSTLQSAPVRNNFAATASDINNILSQYAGTSAPLTPTTFQSWVNTTGCPTACAQYIYDGAQFVQTGTINQTAHTFTPISGAGTVTAVSVVSQNGFAGTSSGGATPALTLTTTITGLLKGNGTAISAATLTSAHFYVGNGSGVPTDVAMSGDCSLANTGAVTCLDTNGTPFGSMATQSASSVAITGGTITGLGAPINPSDAATKAYVDSSASGLTVHAPVAWATAAVLPNTPTYSNGSSGVGATLTAGSDAAIVVDGNNPSLADRVLVKNQATPAQNGVYTVTTVGDGSTAWVLTRATDFNTAEAGEIATNAYFLVTGGTVNAITAWTLTTTGTITVGTTGLTFTQFSGANQYSAGTGLSLTGSTFSIATTGVGAGGPTGSTSVVPVITWNAEGQLTAVTTATVTPAAIGALSTTVSSGDFIVGNGSNVGTAVAMSGDATLANTGAVSVNHLSHVTDASLANSGLVNDYVIVNTVTCTLGSSGCTITTAASSIAVGTTTLSGGTNNYLLTYGTGTLANVSVASLFTSPPSIGNTTPGSGAFTTLSASSTVSGTGITALFASPPAIGGTTPAAIAATTLSASSTVSGVGFSNYFASPPALGGTSPAAVNGTTIGATGAVTAFNATSLPSGGTTGDCFLLFTSGIGFCAGTGAPTLSAPKGSIYADNNGGLPYYNNNGSTGWTQIGSGGTTGTSGTTEYTGSTALASTDNNKTVDMDCGSACTVSMPTVSSCFKADIVATNAGALGSAPVSISGASSRVGSTVQLSTQYSGATVYNCVGSPTAYSTWVVVGDIVP